jgi:Domain of unknown function (DUF4129)
MSAWRRYILCLFLLGAGFAEPDRASTLTPDQYRAELDRVLAASQQLQQPGPQIPELINSLPPSWRVQSDQRTFEVSTEWLRAELHGLQEKFDPQTQNRIVGDLQSLRRDLDEYEKPAPDSSKERSTLSAILARGEFRSTHGPTWWDRLKQKLIELLLRILGRSIRSSAIPVIGKVLFYGLIALAVLAVAYWVYRSIRESAEMERVVPESEVVSAKDWALWMAEAREAAQRGAWRDAIHLAYWAGISFLEASGMWRPDKARTPREYLRLLPAASEHRDTLTSLTSKFEVVWYGKHEADPQAFSETLEELARIGCR